MTTEAPALRHEAYLEIRRHDYQFGQEISRVYRELPEGQRAAAVVEMLKAYSQETLRLYRQLFGLEE
jgi:hypothetical protein